MLKIYDKAQWHIDAGENAEVVVNRLRAVFEFLNKNGMLALEGKEIIDLGIDSSVSIHERMLTEEGKRVMDAIYDKVIDKPAEEIVSAPLFRSRVELIREPRPLEEQILEVLVMTIREGKNPNDAYNNLSPMARAKMDQFANFMIRMIEKYGREVLAEIEEEERQKKLETKTEE